MTREEAITALGDRNNLLWGMSKEEQKYYSEALDMAISALSDYDKMQKISLDLAFENDELINKMNELSADGDCISRQAVIELIYHLDLDFANSFDTHTLTEIYSCVKALPSVENKSEWIPVSERLPEEEHEVYCQLSDGSNAVLYVQDNWGQMEWVDGMMGTGTYDVVAWRERPEPYKAESPETCKGCIEPCIMYEPDMRACKKKVTERGE